MVVLDEIVLDAELGKRVASVCLLEEPPRVSVDDRLYHQGPFQLGGDGAHRRQFSQTHARRLRTSV
jgi:hypothetical protein